MQNPVCGIVDNFLFVNKLIYKTNSDACAFCDDLTKVWQSWEIIKRNACKNKKNMIK